MKVAVVGPGFVRAGYIGNHVRAFPRVGVTCKLAAPGRGYQLRQPVFCAPGLEFYQFRARKGAPIWPSDWRLLKGLVDWADLVHVYHTAFPVCALAAVVARLRGKPLVVTTADHVVRKSVLWRSSSYVPWLLADRVVAFAEEEVRWLASVGVRAAKVVKVPLGIDVDRLSDFTLPQGHTLSRDHTLPQGGCRRDDEPVTVLFVGRKHPDKNLETLIRCVRAVCDRADRPVRCVLVGRRHVERYARRLERLIDDLGLQGAVDFVGDVPDGMDFMDYYARSDIFVDVARFGTFEVVVLEAMAFGLPVVVSERVGVAEIVAAEDCGIVVDPDDGGAIVQALLELVQGRERREQMGSRGRAAARERYDYASMAQALKRLYEDVLAHV